MANNGNKAKYWVGILYPEHLKEDWQDILDNHIMIPYAYCIHDKDKDEKGNKRKEHIHLIFAYSNTTTYNHALSTFNDLYIDGQSLSKIERIQNIRGAYDYLIHDTEACSKSKKYKYDISERITGADFDIGCYEQISQKDKKEAFRELMSYIRENKVLYYSDLEDYVFDTNNDLYDEALNSYGFRLDRYIRANYIRQRDYAEAENLKIEARKLLEKREKESQ